MSFTYVNISFFSTVLLKVSVILQITIKKKVNRDWKKDVSYVSTLCDYDNIPQVLR